MPARPSASDSGGSTACGAKAGRPPPRIQRERQSSSQQRAVRTQSRSSRSGTGRPACASSCSRRRPCTARGSTCCPTPPRPPRPCPAPARRRTPCRRAPRGRTIGPTRARGNEGTFFTIDAVRPYTPIFRFTAPLRATPLWRAAVWERGACSQSPRPSSRPCGGLCRCMACSCMGLHFRDSFNPIYR